MQIEMVDIDYLVRKEHPYRKMKNNIDFDRVMVGLELPEQLTGAIGYTKRRLLLCLVLQFMEDLSDRELERFLSENVAGKWFCEFMLAEKTPDFTLFTKVRKNLGVEAIAKVFRLIKQQLREKGYMVEQFTFVDATALISKTSLWEERDRGIQAGQEKLNNENISEHANDKEARFGAKSKNKLWYGYKSHTAVDMDSGMISNVDVTPANITDAEGGRAVLPNNGYVYADKGYVAMIDDIILHGAIPRVILRDNMIDKNRKLDKEISKRRAPFERVFSHRNKHVRYIGTQKNLMAELLFAIGFNLKRLMVLA